MLFYKLSRQDRIMIKEPKSLSIIQHAKNSALLRKTKKLNLSENTPQIHTFCD